VTIRGLNRLNGDIDCEILATSLGRLGGASATVVNTMDTKVNTRIHDVTER